MSAPSRIEIDLSAIETNVAVLRRALATGGPRQVRICAVVKDDAYGLGANRIAKRLEVAAVDMLAVFTTGEARALIDAAVSTPILILSPVRAFARNDSLYRGITQGRVHMTLHDRAQLQSLADHSDRYGVILPLHLEVNTGLSRGGASPDEAAELVEEIARRRRLRLAGVSTHFASADSDAERTTVQARRFDNWLLRMQDHIPEDCLVHEAATFGVFRAGDRHRDMVRVGLSLYGYAAEEMADPGECDLIEHAADLRPAVRWLSDVAHVAMIPAGETVGYGATWCAGRETRLALIPVGYADGYPLALTNRGVVGIQCADGEMRYAPVAGRVSMDQITVDVTDFPLQDAGIGAPVEVFGADKNAPNYLPTMAAEAGTISHELLCRISGRVERRYPARDPMSEGPGVTGAAPAWRVY